MTRFDGSNVLVIDEDRLFAAQLIQVLTGRGATCFSCSTFKEAKEFFQKYSFDVVISNYYVTDGLIHQLIDWCKGQLDFLPLFISLNEPTHADRRFMIHQCIAENLVKKTPHHLIDQITPMLFSFEDFKNDIIDYFEENGILIELVVKNTIYHVKPIELDLECMTFDVADRFQEPLTAILKVRVKESQNKIDNFVALGMCETTSNGTSFKVHRSYEPTWAKLLINLGSRQLRIKAFLKKAAGL